ncbi:hypothetical protein [Mesorhizobium japonicum]
MDESGSGKLAVIKVLGNGKRRFNPVAMARLIGACLETGFRSRGLRWRTA